MKKLLLGLFILASFLLNVFTAKAENNIALPDLVITDFTWSPETPIKTSPIGNLHVYLTIKNIGNASVVLPENMRVSIYKENKSYGGFGLGTAYYKLEPGDSQVFDFNTTQSPNILESSGTFDLILAVDDGGASSYLSSGLVKESNEYNNTFYKKIKINDSYDTPNNDSDTHSSPIVSFPDARYVDVTVANLQAVVTFLGNPKMTARGICYTPSMTGITPGLTSGGTCMSSADTSDKATIAIYPTGLMPNTEYKFRGYATNSINMTGYSVEGYFKTKPADDGCSEGAVYSSTTGQMCGAELISKYKVLTPNGNEVYKPGDKVKVTWVSSGPLSGTNVSISLVDDSVICNKGVVGCQSKFLIAYNISNVGSYIWNTNSKMSGPSTGPNSVSIRPGTKYKIEVCGTTVNYCDYSDSYFSVVSNDALFKIKISSELTSSGASRQFDADLTFDKNVLDSGIEKYSVWQGGGCTSNCNYSYSCVVSNHKWVDGVSGGECKINVYSPLTKSEVDKDIENKVIVPMSQCGHLDICYEIINSVDLERDTGCIAGQNYSSTTGKACALGLYKNSTPITRTLKRGVSGDDVRRLQEFLQIYADGVYGRGTTAKVKEWQLKNGLYPDGSFGGRSRATAGL